MAAIIMIHIGKTTKAYRSLGNNPLLSSPCHCCSATNQSKQEALLLLKEPRDALC